MARRNISVLLLVVAFCALATGQEVCQSTDCKQLADDLQHKSMNVSVNPCEDFYEYVCGNWVKYHPLTEVATRRNSFAIRSEQVQHEINDAIKNAANSKSHSVQYLSQLYLECNDTNTLESRGIKPLHDLIDSVLGEWPLLKGHAPTTTKRWPEMFTRVVTMTSVSPIFRVAVQYERHVAKKMLFIAPGGTGLAPSLLTSTLHHEVADAYRKFIKNSALLLGATDDAKLDTAVDKIIHLETKIAQVANLSPLNFIRMSTFAGLNTASDNRIDWLATVNAVLTSTKSSLAHFKTTDRVGIVNQAYIHGAIQVLEQATEEDVQNLLGWLLVMVYGPLTTHKFRHNEALFHAIQTGISTEIPTPQFCFNVVNSKLSFAMGRVYVDTHFTPSDKKAAVILVDEVKASFKKVLETNTWLDDQTRTLALQKLAAVKENVGYPDWVVSDTDLDKYYNYLHNVPVTKGKFLESALELNLLTMRNAFDTLDTPINHTLMWPMTPATVNAAYQPMENSITIPAAVLNSPFFDADRPFSMNYGAIGAIIGHEFTHGFDNLGRRFDLNGQEKNWWTNATLTEFNHKASCFIQQYSAILDPVANLHVNGIRTLGENIADNGGVKEAFNAFHNHEAKYGKSPVLPNLKLNADQLFFVSYARNWCSVYRKETMINMIQTNPHPPDRYRVNVVLGNSPHFSQTFNCPSGSKMNPVNKCAVW